jgi:hypothetical protein
MEAVRARTFVDAVGINIHRSWRRTIWQTGDWQPALIELGVANVRGLVGSGLHVPVTDDVTVVKIAFL